jgi:pSer/pThr/pTyr-binding forkhead associated (FHA) protein
MPLPKKKKTGIDRRVSPPKGYPRDKSQYADPANFKFPIDRKHISGAISYFNKAENRRGYNGQEQATIARRIVKAAKKFGKTIDPRSDLGKKAGLKLKKK